MEFPLERSALNANHGSSLDIAGLPFYVRQITPAQQILNMIYRTVNLILFLQYCVCFHKFTVWILFQLLLTVSMTLKVLCENYSHMKTH